MVQPQWWWLLEPYWTLLRNFSRRASTPPSSPMDSTRPYSWLYRYLLGYMSIYGYHSHQPEHLNKYLCLIMTQWKTNCYLHSVVAHNVKSRPDPVNFVGFPRKIGFGLSHKLYSVVKHENTWVYILQGCRRHGGACGPPKWRSPAAGSCHFAQLESCVTTLNHLGAHCCPGHTCW